jgi:hypothetical protein
MKAFRNIFVGMWTLLCAGFIASVILKDNDGATLSVSGMVISAIGIWFTNRYR